MKHSLVTVALLLIAVSAFAHAGHQHHLLGTVKSLSGETLVITTVEGKDVTVTLTNATAYERGSREDLTDGRRVSVEVDNANRALKIKIGSATS